MAVKVTKKRKKLIALPGEYMTKVYVRNNVANARYSYSLMQERIFNFVIFYLRHYTKQVIAGNKPDQLELFKVNPDKNIDITIPLSMLCDTPSYYGQVRKSAQELASITVMIEHNKDGKEWVRYRGLFSYVDVPKENNRSASLVIQISRDVAEMLVNIEVKDKIPTNYTSFIYQICAFAKNKYTPRLYKFISGWKVKKYRPTTLTELRELLQLGDKYKDFNDIKNRILEPVRKELTEKADCWFNYTLMMEGKKVTGIKFIVIDVKFQEYQGKMKDYIIYLLKDHLKLTDGHIDVLRPLLEDFNNYDAITYKVVDVANRIRTDRTITNPQAYAVKAIQNAIAGK